MHKKEKKKKANLEPLWQVQQNAPSGPVTDWMLENGRPVGNRPRRLPSVLWNAVQFCHL